MSLSRIEIRNFQSLRRVDLDLGQFTVIVGPSSSGKSALMRACRALASNVRGSSVITRGQKRAAITARLDHRTVTLERSETSGLYRLSDGQGSELTYTKLNGGVPEAITNSLRIAPVPANGTSVNFASQFDRPYLLDDSGANVARTLGELTNVNTIFEAVRLANKKRLAASSLLKIRRADLDATKSKLAGFECLAERLVAVDLAEQMQRHAIRLREDLSDLEGNLKELNSAQSLLGEAQAVARHAPPDAERLSEVWDRFFSLYGALMEAGLRQQERAEAEREVQRTAQVLDSLNEEFTQLLHDAKVCPTCGQSTSV